MNYLIDEEWRLGRDPHAMAHGRFDEDGDIGEYLRPEDIALTMTVDPHGHSLVLDTEASKWLYSFKTYYYYIYANNYLNDFS